MTSTNMTPRFITACVAAAGIFAIVGCSNETEGDRAMAKADKDQHGAMMIKDGEAKVESAKAMEARGQAMKDQGDNAKGDSTMAEGMAAEKAGQAMIEEGKKLQAK